MVKQDERLVVAEIKDYFGGTGTQGRVMETFRREEFLRVSLKSGHLWRLRQRMRVNRFGVFQKGRLLRTLS